MARRADSFTSAERLERAEAMAGQLAGMPPAYPDRPAYNAALKRFMDWLNALPEASRPTSVGEGSQGAYIRMMGLRSSSTSGLVGACHNWIARARALGRAQ